MGRVERLGKQLGVVVTCVLLWSAPALAREVHVFKLSFGGPGSGPGQFVEPAGVAVNDATHHVYVADSGNNRIEEMDASGAFVKEFDGTGPPQASAGALSKPTEIAVDNSNDPLDLSADYVYVVDRGHGVIDKFNPSGTYENTIAGAFGDKFQAGEAAPLAIMGIAIDQAGHLWVTTREGPIYEFDDALQNDPIARRRTVYGGASDGVGIDNSDNLYINVGLGDFAKITNTGETVSSPETAAPPFGKDGKAHRVAVDAVGEEVYLDNFESIEAFDVNGGQVESCAPPASGECFGVGQLSFSKGVAVDSSNGTVYATDAKNDLTYEYEAIVLPDVTLTPISEQHTRSVTLNGTVNPRGTAVVSCVFEYGATASYGNSVPCSHGNLGIGNEPVPVSVHLEGLTPETTYHYRLVAQNAAPRSSHTPDRELFTGPLLERESVSDVTTTSGTLQDTVDPNGNDTHYYIEYGPTATYGMFTPEVPPGVDLGSSLGPNNLEVHLQDLLPGSGYHYRFVVVQDGEVFTEEDRSFTTQSRAQAAGLADGRSWELVTPANKKGAVIEPLGVGGQVQAANDGRGITFVTEGGAVGDGTAGKATYAQIVSTRGSTGWKSTDLTLPGILPEDEEPAETVYKVELTYHLFSPDLSIGVVEPQSFGTPLLSPEAHERTVYLRDNKNAAFVPLVTEANTEGRQIEEVSFRGISAPPWQMHFLAATPDLKHVILKTPKALTPDAIDEETVKGVKAAEVQWNLYEWNDGALKLVNYLPNAQIAHGQFPANPIVRLAAMTDGGGYGRGGAQREMSADGRRVAWTWGEPYTESKLKSYRGLFVRDMVEERTVQVGGPSAIYQTMSADGSKIFYIENGDLFVQDFASGARTDLTSDHGLGESSGEVQEVVSGVSEDGAYVYFVARGALAGTGVHGQYNLYLLHDTGSGWTTSLIGVLSERDRPSWYAENFSTPMLGRVSSRVSPNGRFFAFMSEQPLTGYDNRDVGSGEPIEEVYLYDSQSAKLVCASCDPTGARPHGVLDRESAELLVDRLEQWSGKYTSEKDREVAHLLGGNVPGWDDLANDPATYQPRYLSDEGRLYFDSPDGLTPEDANGLEDVYQFEPEGVGDCTSAMASGKDVFVRELAGLAVGGCVALMSSGVSGDESAFYDASVSGNDVFFATTGKLVGEDYDKGYDLYDAHVCSDAVPCRLESPPHVPCDSGDSCKGAPSPQPEIFGPPPSATFNGVGNFTVAPPVHVTLTNAQKLARALRVCRKEKGKRRARCERRARKRYPVKVARKSGNGRQAGRKG